MKKFLQSDESPIGAALTDVEVSFIACTSTLAGAVGVPLYTYIAEVYGRKVAVIIIKSTYAVSWILKLLATHKAVLIAARIFGGVSLGGSFIVIPMYIREISQDSLRGSLMSLALSFQHVGVLAVYAMGSYLGYHITLWIALCVSIIVLCCTPIAPETPVFLVKKGKLEEAHKVLATLRGLSVDDVIIQNEMNYMQNEQIFYETEKKLTLVAISGNIGNIVVRFQPLLIGAFSVSAVSLSCLASALLVQWSGATVPSWVPVVTIATAVFSYTAGVVPIVNIILSDMFKFQVRGKLIGLIHMFIWNCTFLQVIFFELISSALGLYSVFFMSASVNVLGALLVFFLIPETKGKTTKEIEDILAGNKSATPETTRS
ncbi:facilitated trehalose transporter Tret1-like [Ostrinia nubilalis]|uniref:facilitated trehalose transporter Tret1-like n=1 Tax=Ostrinia nubilalis TaxID=29057 RepID=UPI00308238FF